MNESLAECPEKVQIFLTHLSSQLNESLKEDYADLLAMKKRSEGQSDALQIWDVPHFIGQVVNQREGRRELSF